MRLFRSEEHVRRAYSQPGETFPVEQLGRLALGWYGDRLAPDWQPGGPAGLRAVLGEVGLTGPFWRLAG